MKQFFAKHANGAITYCNWPIEETGADSFVFDVNPADLEAVQEGLKDWKIESGQLEIVQSTRKTDEEAAKAAKEAEAALLIKERTAIKKKLEKGEATLAEVQEALSKLI